MKSAILLAAVLVGCTANGALINNLSTAFNSVGPLVGHSGWAANGFQTRAGDSYALDSVVLRLNRNISGTVHVYIAANAANNAPGAILGSFGDLTVGSYADYTFLPQSSLILAPQTKYWVVVSPATSSVESFWTGLGTYTQSQADWIGAMTSSDAGSSWGSLANVRPGMEINASPVPEPAAAGLCAVAFVIVCCALDCWRRKARIQPDSRGC
jgi:hypothetical protein